MDSEMSHAQDLEFSAEDADNLTFDVPLRKYIDVHMHLTESEYLHLLSQAMSTGQSLSEIIREGWQLDGRASQNGVYDKVAFSQEKDAIAVVSWVNKPEMYQKLVLPAFHPNGGFQQVSVPVKMITIPPEMGCKNIGEAYELGRLAAKKNHGITNVVYVHQDAFPVDWRYLDKVLLAHKAGAGGTGIIGCVEPTGGAWFHGKGPQNMSGFIDMGTGRIIGYEERAVQVVDGLVFTCSMDLPWSTDYEGPHMAVEDMCMKIMEAGKEVWNISTQFIHLSPGSVDDAFWRSVQKFREKWAHRLPKKLPSIEDLKLRTELERKAIGLDANGNVTADGQEMIDRWNAESKALLDRNRTPSKNVQNGPNNSTDRWREQNIDALRRKISANQQRKGVGKR